MASIIIGTTPTVTYTFSTVDVSDIVSSRLTVMQSGSIIIDKDLDDATVGENSLSYTLTQAETLALGTNSARMMHNYLLSDGTRGASEETIICGKTNHVTEEMTT